jgi:DNA-binding HxlR family transcriptional regulator
MLSRVGDKWSLLVIAMLERMPGRRGRFSDLKRAIPGISQRMLTATLRNLERDGMLTRYVFPVVRCAGRASDSTRGPSAETRATAPPL